MAELLAVGDHELAEVRHVLPRPHEAAAQARDRGDQLEGGPRHVLAAHGVVGLPSHVGNCLVVRLGDAVHPGVQVVVRVGGHGEHRAVANVEHDRGGVLGRGVDVGALVQGLAVTLDGIGEHPLHVLLQAGVDVERHGVTGGGADVAQGADDLAVHVHLEQRRAVLAPQVLVVVLLDAVLADG